MQLIAFVPSTDLGRSQRFYADVLGLTVEETSPYDCVLRSGPTMLRVTLVEELSPQPFTVLGWQTDDLQRELTRLTGLGVEFLRFDGMGQGEAGVWTAPGGDEVAWFHDPDGNTLSFTRFAAAR